MKTKSKSLVKKDIKPLDLGKLFLAQGKHKNATDGMCVIEAASMYAGEPFSDNLKCGCPVIQAFLRKWNDRMNDTDRQELKHYLFPIIGSKSTREVEIKRAWLAADWSIRIAVPIALRAAKIFKLADELSALPEITNVVALRVARPVLDAALEAAREVRRKIGYSYWAAVAAVEAAAAVAAVEAAAAAVAVEAAAAAVAAAAVAVVAAVEAAVAKKIRAELTLSAHDLVARMLAVKE